MAARATRRRSVRKEVEVKIDHKMEAGISPPPLKTEKSHLTIMFKSTMCLIPTISVEFFEIFKNKSYIARMFQSL